MATIKEIDRYCSLCMDINCTGCEYHDVHFNEWDSEKKELKKIGQKSAECGEEDLPEFESYLCLMLQKFRTKGICTNGEIIDYVKEHSQKLKDTLCYAWSEEDKEYLNFVIDTMKTIQVKCTENEIKRHSNSQTAPYYGKVINWLKSLRPQKQWKPTEEQIATIEYIIRKYESTTIHLYDGAAKQLYLLLEQLKRL